MSHQKVWRDTSLDGRFSTLLGNAKLSAKRKHLEFDLDRQFLITLYQKQHGRCALSGLFMTLVGGKTRLTSSLVSIDRIENTRGYTRDNVHLVAASVNYMRGPNSISDFKAMCKLITEYQS